MKITPEFQVIIDAAVKDSKLSKKERKILLNRAEKEGLDLPEFELCLDSLVPAQKINWVRYGIISAVIFICSFWFWNNGGAERYKYGCSDMEDCLVINEFDGARAHAKIGRTHIPYHSLQRIISAEISFYLANNEPSLAVRSLREYAFEYAYDKVCYSNDSYNEECDWYNTAVISLLPNLIADERQEWLDKIRPIAIKGEKIEISSGLFSEDRYEFSLDTRVKEDQMKLYGLK